MTFLCAGRGGWIKTILLSLATILLASFSSSPQLLLPKLNLDSMLRKSPVTTRSCPLQMLLERNFSPPVMRTAVWRPGSSEDYLQISYKRLSSTPDDKYYENSLRNSINCLLSSQWLALLQSEKVYFLVQWNWSTSALCCVALKGHKSSYSKCSRWHTN